jgi:hypothetical protein
MSSVLAAVGEEEESDVEFASAEIYAQTIRTVQVTGIGGYAFSRAKGAGVVVIPIGVTTAVPQTTADAINQQVAQNGGFSFSRNEGVAAASFTYEADLEITEDLVFHGHLFIATNGAVDVLGNASFNSGNMDVDASITNGTESYSIRAEFQDDETWDVTIITPSGQVQENYDGVNLHLVFEIPIEDGHSFVITSANGHDGLSISTTPTDSGQLNLSTMAGAWGYVTRVDDDLTPGDFNGDGEVDGDDFDIWEVGDPTADADEDGDIDDDDYQIWLANAAPKVSNVIISSTVPNSYGTNPPYEFDDVDGSQEQLRTVPVGGADKIAIRFTKDVDIASGDLDLVALNKVVTEPSVSSFDPPTIGNNYTGTWTLSSALPGAQYLVRLAETIEDLDGNALDGEWTNPGSILSSVTTSEFPSGDHFEGGDFEFVFTYLPGDANRDLQVDLSDYNTVNNNFGSSKSWVQGDFTGDGSVGLAEFNIVLDAMGRDWRNLAILSDYDSDFDVDGSNETTFLTYYNSQNANADLDGNGSINSADYDAFYELLGFGIDLDVLT